MPKDKLQELYERFCVGCPSAKKCHETCENCEEFEEELQKIKEKHYCVVCSVKASKTKAKTFKLIKTKLKYKLEKCILDDEEYEPIKFIGIKAYCSVCGEPILCFKAVDFNNKTIKSIADEMLKQKKE